MAKMIFSIGGSSGLGWQDFVEVAQTCDELGFDGFYPSDHLGRISDRGPDSRLDSMTVLAALAGYTKKLRLGALVMGVLFRPPVITAKIVGAIDHATGGRAVLGIGAGNVELEYVSHGYGFPGIRERQERLDEALTLIRALWTQESATFEGKYYQVHDVAYEPKPVQKPYPHIIVGGHGLRTQRIAARHADEWNVQGPLRIVGDYGQQMQGVCAELGRDYSNLRRSVQMNLLLTDSKQEAETYQERQVAAATQSPRFKLSPHYESPEEQVGDIDIVGGVEEVKEQIQEWLDSGVTHLNLRTPRPFNRPMLERFAAEVIPAFS